MQKKIYLPIVTLVLCLTLLASAFLFLPKSTQAASNTPISVTQPSNCTQLQADASGNTLDEQTCAVSVSIKYNVSSGVHFSVSYSASWCYDKCYSYKTWSGTAIALVEGNSITQANTPIHVLLIVPYYTVHGNLTLTFVFTGPSNSVKVQTTAGNSEG